MKKTAIAIIVVLSFICQASVFQLFAQTDVVNESSLLNYGLFIENPADRKVSGTQIPLSKVAIMNNRIHVGSVRAQKFSGATSANYGAVSINTPDTDKNLLGFSYIDPSISPTNEQQFHFKSGFDGTTALGADNKLDIFGPSSRLIQIAPFTSNDYILNRVGVRKTAPRDSLDINGPLYVDERIIARLETVEGHSLFFSYNDQHSDSQISINVLVSGTLKGNGTFSTTNTSTNPKTFIIDHPNDADRYLIHSAIEGPENGVYYRGKGKLKNGLGAVKLPDYVEPLVDASSSTITVTPINSFNAIKVKKRQNQLIKDGVFMVESESPEDMSFFHWEIKFDRDDIPKLVPEPFKRDVYVKGYGPYRYTEPRKKQ